jgi:hypothetical protein
MTPTNRKPTSWQRLRAELQTALLAGIPEHLQRLAWSAEQLQAAQRDGLRRLLGHAVQHAPFHRRRLAGIDVDRLEPADLSSLPVMTKADMMAALEEVFTDRRLTRELVEVALAATGTQPVPILDQYVALATGGSSGQRGVVVYDPAGTTGYELEQLTEGPIGVGDGERRRHTQLWRGDRGHHGGRGVPTRSGLRRRDPRRLRRQRHGRWHRWSRGVSGPSSPWMTPAKAGFVNRGQINVSTLTCVEAVMVKVQED